MPHESKFDHFNAAALQSNRSCRESFDATVAAVICLTWLVSKPMNQP